jgi:hypothetical protein
MQKFAAKCPPSWFRLSSDSSMECDRDLSVLVPRISAQKPFDLNGSLTNDARVPRGKAHRRTLKGVSPKGREELEGLNLRVERGLLGDTSRFGLGVRVAANQNGQPMT